MHITKEDLVRYFVIEGGLSRDLIETMFKRRSPKFLEALEIGGIELDETQPEIRELCAKIKKWKDWHIDLGDYPQGANKTG